MEDNQNFSMENPHQITLYLKSVFGKAMLSKKDICELLDISIATLNRRIAENKNIPNYNKSSDSKTAKVQFPIFAVAEYLHMINEQTVKISTNY